MRFVLGHSRHRTPGKRVLVLILGDDVPKLSIETKINIQMIWDNYVECHAYTCTFVTCSSLLDLLSAHDARLAGLPVDLPVCMQRFGEVINSIL